MGFFKDFKEDLSGAVNGISEPVSDNADDDLMVNTLNDPELAKMAEDYKKEAQKSENTVNNGTAAARKNETHTVKNEHPSENAKEAADKNPDYIADETAVITEGLSIGGDLDSIGSIDLFGTVDGNVTCRGKLTVTGTITGNSKADEIFANNAQIDGNVEAKGTIKIGEGTVIVGNITASSAVIAGAVKGDIDVHGPVIIDSTAVIAGDIKSKSVQINNGAAIDGRCSQCYAEVNMDNIFNIKTKKNK